MATALVGSALPLPPPPSLTPAKSSSTAHPCVTPSPPTSTRASTVPLRWRCLVEAVLRAVEGGRERRRRTVGGDLWIKGKARDGQLLEAGDGGRRQHGRAQERRAPHLANTSLPRCSPARPPMSVLLAMGANQPRSRTRSGVRRCGGAS
eukprot:scaffold30255_cov45-Phaeocystis_antarctica.AAC.2